jgi:F-type H+-transporting ATPase subunit delta
VQVTTAVPLSAELAGRVADQIRSLVDGEPMLEQVVDPELIGGIVVRVGDTVYDGSLAAQLEGTRQRMIRRTADEVQARRDRFRYTPRD